MYLCSLVKLCPWTICDNVSLLQTDVATLYSTLLPLGYCTVFNYDMNNSSVTATFCINYNVI